jgi:bacteriorhodopsin
MQSDNLARHEYLMGVAIGSMFASPAWYSAAIGAHLIQTKIHKVMRFGPYTICALISLVLLYYLVLG